MRVGRRDLRDGRAGLPNTVGKNSLFVKEIIERYGRQGGYVFDPAFMVYLLAASPEAEEEKREDSEEKALTYVIREREAAGLHGGNERTREFAVHTMKKTVLPGGLQMLRQSSERKQTEYLIRNLSKQYEKIQLVQIKKQFQKLEERLERYLSRDAAAKLRVREQAKVTTLLAELKASEAETRDQKISMISEELIRQALAEQEDSAPLTDGTGELAEITLREQAEILHRTSEEIFAFLLDEKELERKNGYTLRQARTEELLERFLQECNKTEVFLLTLRAKGLLEEEGRSFGKRQQDLASTEFFVQEIKSVLSTYETRQTRGGVQPSPFIYEMKKILNTYEESASAQPDESVWIVRELREAMESMRRSCPPESAEGSEPFLLLREIQNILELQEARQAGENVQLVFFVREIERILDTYEAVQPEEQMQPEFVAQEIRRMLDTYEAVQSEEPERSELFVQEIRRILDTYEAVQPEEQVKPESFVQEIRRILDTYEAVQPEEQVKPESFVQEIRRMLDTYEAVQPRERVKSESFVQEIRRMLDTYEAVRLEEQERPESVVQEIENVLNTYEVRQTREALPPTSLIYNVREILNTYEEHPSAQPGERTRIVRELRATVEKYVQELSAGESNPLSVQKEIRNILDTYEAGRSEESVQQASFVQELQNILNTYEAGRSEESVQQASFVQELQNILNTYEAGRSEESVQQASFVQELQNILNMYEAGQGEEGMQQISFVQKIRNVMNTYEAGQAENGTQLVYEVRNVYEEPADAQPGGRILNHELREIVEKHVRELSIEFIEESEPLLTLKEIRKVLEFQEESQAPEVGRTREASQSESLALKITGLLNTYEAAPGREERSPASLVYDIRNILNAYEEHPSAQSGDRILRRELREILERQVLEHRQNSLPPKTEPFRESAKPDPPDFPARPELTVRMSESRPKADRETMQRSEEKAIPQGEEYQKQKQELSELRSIARKQEEKLKAMEDWKQDMSRKTEKEKERQKEKQEAAFWKFQEQLRLERMRRGLT